MHRVLAGVFGWLLLSAVAHAAAAPRSAPLEVRIAVAANFKQTLERMGEAFNAKHGGKLVVSAGATGQLYSQIVQGAPFDLFFSADRERAERLEREGLAVAGTRFTYAVGRLVAWRPQRLWQGELASVLRSPEIDTVAIANPQVAPYGAAAQQVLQALQGSTPWTFRLVQGESLGQAYQFVASGHAQLGFVSLSQIYESEADADRPLRKEIVIVDPKLYAPLEQQAVLLRGGERSQLARDFLAFVRSPEGVSIIAAAGYDTPMPR
ncbi:MAG: molybdate ABC transporter substrate-binding protein [Steroidobacteraceae bacterium]